MTFNDVGIDLKGRTEGQLKTLCPKCSHTRRKAKEPCLSVNIDEGIWQCHNDDCGWSGTLGRGENTYKLPPQLEQIPALKEDGSVVKWFKKRGFKDPFKDQRFHELVGIEKTYMPHKQEEMPAIVFRYFRNNVLVNKKYRSSDKGFKMHKDAELIFFNLPSMKGKKEVIISEGEPDAMAFLIDGEFDSVISVPNGASKSNNNLQYLDNCYDEFEGIETIYIATDSDEAGQLLMNELARRLGKERCLQVSYPPNCKDANDVLKSYGAVGLKRCIAEAEPFPLEGVIMMKEVEADTVRLYDVGVERGADVKMGDEFNRLCTFKTSLLYSITGVPTHGKSTFLNAIEVNMAAHHGWKFGIFSPEHYPLEYLINRYAELIVGKPFFEGMNDRMSRSELQMAMQFIQSHFYFIRPEGEAFTLDRILEAGRQLVLRYGIKGFTIDPWTSVQHDYKASGLSETQYIEKALNQLTIFKQVNDLAVFLVAHPRKMQKAQHGENIGMYEVPTQYDISGSSHFYNKADVGITVYRNFDTALTEVYIQKVKFRNLGEIGYTHFHYNPLNNRFVPVGTKENNDAVVRHEQARLPYKDEPDDDLFGDDDSVPF